MPSAESTTTQQSVVEKKPLSQDVASAMDDQIRIELQNIFIDLLGSAQKLSYELATLDFKDTYTKDELKDLLDSAKEVVANVKRMHKFLEKHTRRK